LATLHGTNRKDGDNRRDVCGGGRTPWRSIAVGDAESAKTAGAQTQLGFRLDRNGETGYKEIASHERWIESCSGTLRDAKIRQLVRK